MDIQIVTPVLNTLEDAADIVKDILKKNVEELSVQITLDYTEVTSLLHNIIEQETQIVLEEYDILLDNCKDLDTILIDKAVDRVEYEYLKDTLCKKFSNGVLKDPIQYILQYIAHRDHFEIKKDIYNEIAVVIYISLSDFKDDSSKLKEHLNLIF